MRVRLVIVFLLTAALACFSHAQAAGPGEWAATSTMSQARMDHLAVLLHTGSVLIMGGIWKDPANAELYDPRTHTWAGASRMIYPSADTATVLKDGNVLVTSESFTGKSHDTLVSRAQLYEVASGTWHEAGHLAAPFSFETATLLHNGRVLVLSSGGNCGCPYGGASIPRGGPDSQVYDPGTNRWSVVARSGFGGGNHTASLLPDGRVLLVGANSPFPEVYDPVRNAWAFTGPLIYDPGYFTATTLENGMVLIAGDMPPPMPGSVDLSNRAQLYNPKTNYWRSTGDLHFGRWQYGVALLRDGRVMVAGGELACDPFAKDQSKCVLNSVEAYSPYSGQWTIIAPMHSKRAGLTATLLPNGQVLVVGGSSEALLGKPLASAELYTPN